METETSHPTMRRTNLFLKVEIEHDQEDTPEQIGNEIARVISRLYGVRSAELTNFTTRED